MEIHPKRLTCVCILLRGNRGKDESLNQRKVMGVLVAIVILAGLMASQLWGQTDDKPLAQFPIQFEKNLPLTASGKIQKHLLKEQHG